MEVKRLLDVLDRHLADNRFIRAGRKKSASARPSSAGEWSTAPAGGLTNNCASGMTPAISRPKRRTRSTRAGNPTVIPHKSSRRCQPQFCCVLTKYSNDKAQYRLSALPDIVLNLQNFTRSGPDTSIPKFADVKHSGYKPFTPHRRGEGSKGAQAARRTI